MIRGSVFAKSPTNAKFPNLSLGYAGINNPRASLISSFFVEYWKNPNLADPDFAVPQRLPRLGFFDELFQFETSEEILDQIGAKRAELRNQFLSIAEKSHLDESDSLALNHLAKVLSRYGVSNLPDVTLILDKLTGDARAEFRLEVLASELNARISNGGPYRPEAEAKIVAELEGDASVSEEMRIVARSRYLVSSYRYGSIEQQKKAEIGAAECVEWLANHPPKGFVQTRRHSILWRGFAFAKSLGDSRQERCMDHALQLADQIPATTLAQDLIKKENLTVTYQSFSKLSEKRSDLPLAEFFLQQIGFVDPYDSTGHYELGFFYYRHARYNEALHAFQESVRMGPPGYSLSQYCVGMCHKALHDLARAETSFKESASSDENALSPWLELVEIYEGAQDAPKRAWAASHVLGFPPLRAQLSAEEISVLETGT